MGKGLTDGRGMSVQVKLSWMNGQHLRALPVEEQNKMIGDHLEACGILKVNPHPTRSIHTPSGWIFRRRYRGPPRSLCDRLAANDRAKSGNVKGGG